MANVIFNNVTVYCNQNEPYYHVNPFCQGKQYTMATYAINASKSGYNPCPVCCASNADCTSNTKDKKMPIIITVIAVIFVVGIFGRHNVSNKKNTTSKYEFEILSLSLDKDYSDNSDILIVEYNFTNNSNKSQSFSWACNDKVFQYGIECDNSFIRNDNIDTQKKLNDIQPGVTYSVKVGYYLSDTDEPVEVVVTDLYGKETYIDEFIELKNLHS